MITLTTNHSSSSYGIPVFLAGRQAMDYADGFQALRKERGWTVAALAELCGVSARTVEGWEQGRHPRTDALLRLMSTIDGDGGG